MIKYSSVWPITPTTLGTCGPCADMYLNAGMLLRDACWSGRIADGQVGAIHRRELAKHTWLVRSVGGGMICEVCPWSAVTITSVRGCFCW